MREEIGLKDGMRHTYVPLRSNHSVSLSAIHISFVYQSSSFVIIYDASACLERFDSRFGLHILGKWLWPLVKCNPNR